MHVCDFTSSLVAGERERARQQIIMSSALKLQHDKVLSTSSAKADMEDKVDMADRFLSDSLPVLRELLGDLKSSSSELAEVIASTEKIAAQLKKGDLCDEIVDYLESKQQMLLSYCTILVYYLKLKTSVGVDEKGTEHDAVLKKLLEIRYVVEKLKGLDGKLKYQIDRLLGYNALDISEKKASSLRPNIGNLLDGSSDEGEEEEERIGSKNKDKADKNNTSRYDDDDTDNDNKVYKAPKLMAMPYREIEKKSEKSKNILQKKKNKMKNSEIMDALRDEFSAGPEASSSTGVSNFSSQQKKLTEEHLERQNFEEDHFIRTQLTKKQKQSIKKRTHEGNRIDNFSDVGNVGDFDDIIKLSRGSEIGSRSTGKSKSQGLNESTAIKKSLKAFSKANEGMDGYRKRQKM